MGAMTTENAISGSGTEYDPWVYDDWGKLLSDNESYTQKYMKLNPDAKNKVVDYNEFNNGLPISGIVFHNNIDGSGWEIRNIYATPSSSSAAIVGDPNYNSANIIIENFKFVNMYVCFPQSAGATSGLIAFGGDTNGGCTYRNCNITCLLNVGTVAESTASPKPIAFLGNTGSSPTYNKLIFEGCDMTLRSNMDAGSYKALIGGSSGRLKCFHQTYLKYCNIKIEATGSVSHIMYCGSTSGTFITSCYIEGFINKLLSFSSQLTNTTYKFCDSSVIDLKINDWYSVNTGSDSMFNGEWKHVVNGVGKSVINYETIPYNEERPYIGNVGGYPGTVTTKVFQFDESFIPVPADKINDVNYLVNAGFPMMDPITY